MATVELPLVDEHSVQIAAGADDVWPVLLSAVEGFSGTGAGRYARAVGCVPSSAAGPRPLAVGSTIPGFAVTAAVPGSVLALEGRHRFSTYALLFHLEPDGADGPHRCRITAESRAEFPGVAGAAYRLLVVRSGGHVVVVRRMLAGIKRRAER
jgi:hypothetical protein